MMEIIKNCPNFTSLSLYGGSSIFDWRLSNPIFVPFLLNHGLFNKEFWTKTGDTSARLVQLSDTADSTPYLTQLQNHSRKIRRLYVDGFLSHRGQISELLGSYGEQLESACLHDMSASELLKFVNACKNCRFHLRTSLGGALLPSLRILG